ncbi:hypothetical protein, partial [Micromonospora sp. HNM0581]|uniref:hypothetical protein n=1 Tax=Micromonospora sp. HNM0581 TaxID=2716341 RepID=UPI00197BE80B
KLSNKNLENNPDNKIMLPKQKTWHWLIKHPVEFSKNNHTPNAASKTLFGATVPVYPNRVSRST